MRLKESELVLDNGRIYHLGLKEEDLADIIITVGDPNRVKKVSMHFDEIECKIEKREFVTHTGRLGKIRLSVIGTGIGPDNIDIMINEIDAVKNIDFDQRMIKDKKKKLKIIRLGTSGTLQADIPVDSFVASSHGFGLDGLLNFYDYEPSEWQSLFLKELKEYTPELFEICIPTIFKAPGALLSSLVEDFFTGITLTAGGFYAPQGRSLRLGQKMKVIIDKLKDFSYEGLRFTNFEMETSSIYGLAQLLGHEALSINAIIANRANQTFSKSPYETIDRMIAITLEKIEKGSL